MNDFWNDRLILKVYAGSISYGTNTILSDEDIRGICIPPKTYLLGLTQFEQQETKEPDQVIYSLAKFVRLALENNPNILDTLFVQEQHVLYIHAYGKELRNLRYKFLSKRVFQTYSGYAVSQLRKLASGKKSNAGKRAETIEKYGYDSKDAMHLVRLLRMCIEILSEGEVIVYRPDREQLLDIRNGRFSLQEIKEMYVQLRAEAEVAFKKTLLPEQPDYHTIHNWLVETQLQSLTIPDFINI